MSACPACPGVSVAAGGAIRDLVSGLATQGLLGEALAASDEARRKIQRFVHATDWREIVFTRSATEASALHFLMPPLGLLFGWLVFREPVSLLDLVGIVPIALGIALVTRG